VYKGQTSDVHQTEQNGMYFLRIAAAMRHLLKEAVALDEVVAYYHAFGGIPVTDTSLIVRVAALLQRLYQRFLASEDLSPDELAWVQRSHANYLDLFASVNKELAPALTAPIFERVKELRELAATHKDLL
jgi:hypothetical protein